EEQAGQLFRDIALAIMAAVGVSYSVAMAVNPSAAPLLLKRPRGRQQPARDGRLRWLRPLGSWLGKLTDVPALVGKLVYALTGSWPVRLGVIVLFGVATVVGIVLLTPPLDYLPQGNRNIVFGMLIPPPGYNVDQLSELG